jgi:hypothetical protein
MVRIKRSSAAVLAIGAAAVLSLGVAGTAMAAAPQAAHQGVHGVPLQKTVSTSSAAGTWHDYKDTLGDSNETLTLAASGRATFSSHCAGVWSQLGKSVGIALAPSTCGGGLWDFTGALKNGGNLLSGTGTFLNGSTLDSFTWSATR